MEVPNDVTKLIKNMLDAHDVPMGEIASVVDLTRPENDHKHIGFYEASGHLLAQVEVGWDMDGKPEYGNIYTFPKSVELTKVVDSFSEIAPQITLIRKMLNQALKDVNKTRKYKSREMRDALDWLGGSLESDQPLTVGWIIDHLDRFGSLSYSHRSIRLLVEEGERVYAALPHPPPPKKGKKHGNSKKTAS
jgi:hypothetical protein